MPRGIRREWELWVRTSIVVPIVSIREKRESLRGSNKCRHIEERPGTPNTLMIIGE